MTKCRLVVTNKNSFCTIVAILKIVVIIINILSSITTKTTTDCCSFWTTSAFSSSVAAVQKVNAYSNNNCRWKRNIINFITNKNTIVRYKPKSVLESSKISFYYAAASNNNKRPLFLKHTARLSFSTATGSLSSPLSFKKNNNNNNNNKNKRYMTKMDSNNNNDDDASLTIDLTTKKTLKFVDIGANLSDERFLEGSYRGNKRHEPDFKEVIERAYNIGVRCIIITAGTLEQSEHALNFIRNLRKRSNEEEKEGNDNDDNDILQKMKFYSTVGVHPTRCTEFEDDGNNPDEHLNSLLRIAKEGKDEGIVIAIGEMGLDYDRLEFCPKDVQHKYLRKQLDVLVNETGLPMFLHNRNTGEDLYDILKEESYRPLCTNMGGVVHSFDDTIELASKFINDLDLFIGLNGCSLRTDDNLDVVKQLPISSILLETDCPYCDIRKSHPSHKYVKKEFDTVKHEKKFKLGKCVKGRQEPCHIIQVAQVIAGVKGIPLEDLSGVCYDNSMKLYGIDDKKENANSS